jgi:hypothetical protein
MNEKTRREPMTDGEREILFQIQQLQAKWIDTLQMCLSRESSHHQSIKALTQSLKELTQEVQELRQQIGHNNQGSLFDCNDSL